MTQGVIIWGADHWLVDSRMSFLTLNWLFGLILKIGFSAIFLSYWRLKIEPKLSHLKEVCSLLENRLCLEKFFPLQSLEAHWEHTGPLTTLEPPDRGYYVGETPLAGHSPANAWLLPSHRNPHSFHNLQKLWTRDSHQ